MAENGKRNGDIEVIEAAFGAKNRNRLIELYFSSQAPATMTPGKAWEHVYRLLLWADQSNGLAHCYESDKSQPGKNWYPRSLAFHDWVSTSLMVPPIRLAAEIDWLFRRATVDLATEVVRKRDRVTAVAERQFEPYGLRKFPKTGEDPDLVSIVKGVLGSLLISEPSPDQWQLLLQRVRQHLALENKRKNLVGEGFEDVLTHVVRRMCDTPSLDVRTRSLLHELPGFNRVRQGEKPIKVDVAVLRPDKRILITAKWSVRADREKQFAADYNDYLLAQAVREQFGHVLITNEFDPARLMRACEQVAGNALMFTEVVHINTDAIKSTYGATKERTMRKVIYLIDSRRLMSLEIWLRSMRSN